MESETPVYIKELYLMALKIQYVAERLKRNADEQEAKLRAICDKMGIKYGE